MWDVLVAILLLYTLVEIPVLVTSWQCMHVLDTLFLFHEKNGMHVQIRVCFELEVTRWTPLESFNLAIDIFFLMVCRDRQNASFCFCTLRIAVH